MSEVEVFVDDPEANVEWPITDLEESDLDWLNPTATSKQMPGTELACEWLGDPGSDRWIRVTTYGLKLGKHTLRLVNPNGNDLALGDVKVVKG